MMPKEIIDFLIESNKTNLSIFCYQDLENLINKYYIPKELLQSVIDKLDKL